MRFGQTYYDLSHNWCLKIDKHQRLRLGFEYRKNLMFDKHEQKNALENSPVSFLFKKM